MSPIYIYLSEGLKNRHFLFILLFILASAGRSFAQTPGLIFEPATGSGVLVLDPNGDGYISSTNSGWVPYTPPAAAIDQTASEIPFVPMSFPSTEPTSDLGPGPNCSFTDFVDSGNEDPAMYFFDGTNFIFRFRLGGAAPNSKGYSVLIDTDQKFGSSGANADPNYVSGNPGFEIEINLQTNFGVYVYNVDGQASSQALIPTASYTGHTNYQKSIAASLNCNNPDYFYDFYIPFSDLSALGVTAATPLRMVITTQMNPHGALGNNALSDLGGVNDAQCGYSFEGCVTGIIDNYTPTCLTCGAALDRTACPTIGGNIAAGATAVSGSSSEANGTIIYIYKNANATPVCTTSVSSGLWTCSGISPLSAGDTIRATALATGKGISYNTCNATVVAATCTTPLTGTGITLNTKGVCGAAGAAIAGATIRLYNASGTLINTGTYTAAVDGSFQWKCNSSNSNCNSGAGCLSNGGYQITQQSGANCESAPIWICLGSPGASSTPTITPNPIPLNTTSVSGTSGASAAVQVFSNGTLIGSTTASAGGTWTLSGLNLNIAGAIITAKAVESGKCVSAASVNDTVKAQTTPPFILGSYCTTTTISTVNGSSSEAAGTIIQVYVNGVATGTTTTVSSSGLWVKTGLSIAIGSTITAKATATGKIQSAASNAVTVFTATTDATLAVSGTIMEGDTSISGTATTGNTVKVYIDEYLLGSVVASGGSWTLSGLSSLDVYAGGNVYATSTNGALCESAASAIKIVQCNLPVVSLSVSPDSTGICSGSYVANISITNSESGVIYQLYNTSVATGVSKLGTGNDLTISSGTLTGSTEITIKATKISPVTCEVTLTETVVTTVHQNPDSSQTVSDTSLCSGNAAPIHISTSQSGVNYYLRDNSDNTLVSGPVSGTGSAISFTVSPLVTTTYNVFGQNVTTGCNSVIDDLSVVTISGAAPVLISSTPDTICNSGSAILSAAFNSGVLSWYDVLTGGLSLGNGASFITPSISNTTTYYVDATLSGCTSARTEVTATVSYSSNSSLSEVVCDEFILNGITYTSSGIFSQTLINTVGCDSLITLTLTINNSDTSISATACDSITFNGQTYTSSGIYTQTLTNEVGCDSVITLNLTINNSTTSNLTETACDEFTLNGQTYTSSGIYTQTLTNGAGCDSVITLNLTINNSTTSSLTETACDEFTLNSQTYTSSGIYTQTLTNGAGCDSVITLNLTINNSTTSNVTETACDEFTLNSQTYTSSGIYTQTLTNGAGCDSVITLNLTINNSTTSNLTETACDEFTLNGQTYTSSGIYTQTLTNEAGCDSTITLNLTIGGISGSTITATACDSFTLNSQTYLTSGTYSQTIPLGVGCDSVITLNLTINISPVVTVFSTNTICGMDNGSANASVLSGTSPYSYLWDNGETDSAITNLSPGIYSVNITDNAGCFTVATTDILSSSVIQPVTIYSDNSVMCHGDSTKICAPAGYVSYLWNTGQTDSCIYANIAGNYFVNATDSNSCIASSNRLPISFYPYIPISIAANGNIITTYNSGTYQWYLNDNVIPGATSDVYVALQSGDYILVVTDTSGCISTSFPVTIAATDIPQLNWDEIIHVFPNPFNMNLEIFISEFDSEHQLSATIFDITGRKLFEQQLISPLTNLNVSAFSSGVYILKLETDNYAVCRRLVKK